MRRSNQMLSVLRVAVICVGVSPLIGCMSYNVQRYGVFDPSSRTMTVPLGGGSLSGKIKARLYAEGWKLAVDRGPKVTEGKLGEETVLHEYGTFNTRYRMVLVARWEDYAIGGGEVYRYDISIVDNEAGVEVLTMNGRGIDSQIVENLIKAIRENTNQNNPSQ